MDEASKNKERLIDLAFVAGIIVLMFVVGTIRLGNAFQAIGYLVVPVAISLIVFALSSYFSSSRVMQRVFLVTAGVVMLGLFYFV